MSQLVEKAEICKALNYSAKEIDELVLRKQIPHTIGIVKEPYINKFGTEDVRWKKKPGHILFPLEEILAKFSPKPKSEKEPF